MNDELCDLDYNSKSQASLSDYSQIPGVIVQIVFQEHSFCLERLILFSKSKVVLETVLRWSSTKQMKIDFQKQWWFVPKEWRGSIVDLSWVLSQGLAGRYKAMIT